METLETIFYYLQTLKLLDILQNCQAPGPVPGPSQHSYSKERTWIDTIIKQTTTSNPPTRKLFKGGNLEFLLSDCSEFQREDQFNAIIKQANPPYPHPPTGRMRGGVWAKKQHLLKWVRMT